MARFTLPSNRDDELLKSHRRLKTADTLSDPPIGSYLPFFDILFELIRNPLALRLRARIRLSIRKTAVR